MSSVRVQFFGENNDINFPYSTGATGFLIKSEKDYFVITAKHNFKDRTPDELLIPYGRTWRNYLPIEAAFVPPISEGHEDTEFTDLMILKVESTLANQQDIDAAEWFEFSQCVKTLPVNASMLVAGYPTTLQHIDYEEKSILGQRLIFNGSYAGPAESAHCGLIRFNNLVDLPNSTHGGESMSGLSGSPVFFIDESSKPSVVILAGILIRGTKESLKGRFLTSEVIARVLNLIHNGTYREVTEL